MAESIFEKRKRMIDEQSGWADTPASSGAIATASNTDPIIKQNEAFKSQTQAERERKAAKAAARRALGLPE